MSTERPSFGFNSFLPLNYKSKAEAFAKCLQDKLRLLGASDETTENGHNFESTGGTGAVDLSKYTEQEIADNVFLQGPLSYKRRSLPDTNGKQFTNGNGRGKYVVSVVDRRGFSSDSEDSDAEDVPPVKNIVEHPRVVDLQTNNPDRKRLPSSNSVDSTSSFCSCDDGDNGDEDDEVAGSLGSQVKGSPTINNSRLRNFRRKGRDESAKVEKLERQVSQPENDLFFDFDVDCLSPVNLDDEDGEDVANPFEPVESKVSILQESEKEPDTGQLYLNKDLNVLTPPPSPILTNICQDYITEDSLVNSVDQNFSNLEILNAAEEVATILNEELSPSFPEEVEEITLSGLIEDALPVPSDEVIETKCQDDANSDIENETIDVLNNDITGDDGTTQELPSDEELKDPEPEAEISESTEQNLLCDNACDISAKVEEVVVDSVQNEVPQPVTVKEPVKCSVIVTDTENIEIDESYLPPPRMKLRRCSSLKTWKTPPGTPGSKKIVRFADALGLDLADVRTFLDEVPKIPNSAYDDLHYDLLLPAPSPRVDRTLIPMFQQPNTCMDFLQRVRQNTVSLESAILTDVGLLSISGLIRVRNLSFHKSVHVRYTKDSWATYSDMQATFLPNSNDGYCDNFSFTLYGHTLTIGDKLEFAIRYDCSAGQFWDNNGGVNYCFHCMPRGPTPFFPPLAPLGTSPVDTWAKFY